MFENLSWCLDNQGIVGLVFEPTFRMIRDILIPTLERDTLLGHPLEASPFVKEWNKSEGRLELINPEWKNQKITSTIMFNSLEDPERAEGPNADFAHVDEARLVRKFDACWKTITRRLRGSDPFIPYPRGAWVTTTTDAPGSDLFKIFEDPKTKNPESRVYRWSIYDNAYLPEDFIKDVERSHSGGLKDRFIYGKFATVSSGSFEFDSTVHVREIPASRIIVEVRYGVDFGWTNPSAVVVLGYDSDGRVWVLDEFYMARAGRARIAQALREFQEKYGAGPVMCDKSEPETIEYLVGEGFDAQAYEFKREDGLREFGDRFKIAGDGLPRILISSCCVNLISELLEYKTDVKERDHAVDATRYGLKLQDAGSPWDFRFG